MMKTELLQGDILKIEKIKTPVLIVSKDFFNQTGEIIGCPISKQTTKSPLHIFINTITTGYAQCEKLSLLDLNVRGYTIIDRLSMDSIMNITDAIQSIFDYI